jgi:peroxiredoxin/uncharacterized membrane protein YphA (DoxX/SURF4 family)
LAVVFVTAGIGKLLDLEGSRRAIRDFGVPTGLADVAGILLPVAELGVAVALVLRPSAQWAGVAALLLLAAFIGGIANALRHGVAPDCHCFGQLHSEPAGKNTLIRNGVLAVVAAIVIIKGTGPGFDTWARTHSAAEFVAVGLGALAGWLAVLWLQLRTEVHQLRTDIGMARRIAATAPPGLPVGTFAPQFAVESMDGDTVTLASLHERTPTLLVFASPWCSSCSEIFPSIRRWQQTLRDRLSIAIITAGTAKDNEPLRAEYGLEMILLQEERELYEAYRVRGTPTAMLVDPEGKVASAPAESVFGIEPLVRLVLRGGETAAVSQGSVA